MKPLQDDSRNTAREETAPGNPIIRIPSYTDEHNLLLILVTTVLVTTLLASLGLLPSDTAGATATEWRGESEVNVLLGVETDDERGDVDDLLANTVLKLVLVNA